MQAMCPKCMSLAIGLYLFRKQPQATTIAYFILGVTWTTRNEDMIGDLVIVVRNRETTHLFLSQRVDE